MTTRRATPVRALAAAAAAAAIPAPLLAHEGEGFGALLHDLLHLIALGPDHGLRPLGGLLVLAGVGLLLAAVGRAGFARQALRTAGSTAVSAGLVLSIG